MRLSQAKVVDSLIRLFPAKVEDEIVSPSLKRWTKGSSFIPRLFIRISP